MSLRIADLFAVESKWVVITGGSRGLGEMIARAYAENGAKLILSARKTHELLPLAEELGAVAIPADLSRMDEIDRFAAEVARHTPRLDILFNNAGASWGAGFDDFPEAGWDKVMDLNVKSAFFLSQRLAPLLEAAATPQDMARIVNIGSIDGLHVSRVETYSYAASKAAILHLTRMMARNLAPRGIAVNAIAPGYFPSKMTDGIADHINDHAINATPMARWGRPEDIAGVALFLGSPASAWMCGAVVTVDGGYATTA
jgi:NAD(P)-dependent dehydrogenase (short-subunit alcohol dehydrogenase family)